MHLGKVIAVSGSKGKTTTACLIYEILKENENSCYIGGNMGIPLLNKIEEFTPDDIIVLELDSLQLISLKTSPDISVITNILTHNEEFIASQKNMYKYQNPNSELILNYDDVNLRKFEKEAVCKVSFFSTMNKLNNGVILDNGIIKICDNGLRRHILHTEKMSLREEHFYDNVCAAICATRSLVDSDIQIKAVENFKGVNYTIIK